MGRAASPIMRQHWHVSQVGRDWQRSAGYCLKKCLPWAGSRRLVKLNIPWAGLMPL